MLPAAMPLIPIEVVAIEARRSFAVSSHSPGTLRQEVVTGKRKHHFTLPLVEVSSQSLAGYIHASWTHLLLILLPRLGHMDFMVS